MINSRWGAEVIDDARNCYADDPNEKVDVDEPRFKGQVCRNNVGFQQGKHYDEENTGEHVRNQFRHTLKIIQSNTIDVNSLQKESAIQDLTGFFGHSPQNDELSLHHPAPVKGKDPVTIFFKTSQEPSR